VIALILFDVGDTVLRDRPEYGGPMVSWPTLEMMPGRAASVRSAASTPAEMRGALARVRLDRYFAHVFTARELGVSKPDPLFFDAALAAGGALPHQAVMVGDSFRTDVVGAKLAGLWAIWYNAPGAPPPADTPLAPDAAIQSLSDLPAAISGVARRAGRSA